MYRNIIKIIFFIFVGVTFCLNLSAQSSIQKLISEYKENEKKYRIEAEQLLHKCVKQKKVYAFDVDTVDFDNIEFLIIPRYKIDKEKFKDFSFDKDVSNILEIDKKRKPFLIFLLKEDKYYGMINTDCCNKTYVDINYNYRREDMEPLLTFIKKNKPDLIFQLFWQNDIFWIIKNGNLRLTNLYLTIKNIEKNVKFEDINYYTVTVNEFYGIFNDKMSLLPDLEYCKKCKNTEEKLRIPWHVVGYD